MTMLPKKLRNIYEWKLISDQSDKNSLSFLI